MRRPIIIITAPRADALVLGLRGRHEAAGLMRERCELVETMSAKARELHARLDDKTGRPCRRPGSGR